MADSQSKIDAAAEKAFADAAEKKTAEAATAKPVQAAAPQPVAKPIVAEKPVVAEKTAAAPVVTAPAVPAPVAKAAPKAKPVAKAKKKAAAKKTAAKVTKAPAKKAAAKTKNNEQPALTKLKETIMATAKNAKTADFTKTVKEAAADAQTRLKSVYDKGAEVGADVVEFHKGNIEALVESGKILAAGAQDLGRTYVEDAKGAVETVTADVKKVAAVKSPTELFQLQGEIARRNFDAAIAAASKNTETFIKLANDAFAPVSTRLSLVAEKISKAA